MGFDVNMFQARNKNFASVRHVVNCIPVDDDYWMAPSPDIIIPKLFLPFRDRTYQYKAQENVVVHPVLKFLKYQCINASTLQYHWSRFEI